MGTSEARLANADRREVYLPRVSSAVMQTVSATEPTLITADDPSAAPQLTDVQRPTEDHLYWPQLDLDLSVESIRRPEGFPLVSRMGI